ncbi:MAG: pilin [Candidatus Pacebacteria bacterium]|nr:pilin [Candidatus Paceibacterota bacterium]
MNLSRHFTPILVFLMVLVAVFSVFLLVPLEVQAAGLVPCGGPGEPECNLCYAMQLIQNVIEFAVRITFILAALLFAYAGFLFFTGGSDPGQISKAKKVFTNTFIGIVIVLTSWLVVDILLKTLAGQGLTPFTDILCGQTEAPRTQATQPSQQGGGIQASGSQLTGPGSGAKEYQWTTVPFNQYCSDVKGEGWVNVDSRFCGGSNPGSETSCCGLFPSSADMETIGSSVFDAANTQGVENFASQCADQGGYVRYSCLSWGYDAETDVEVCERAEYSCIK